MNWGGVWGEKGAKNIRPKKSLSLLFKKCYAFVCQVSLSFFGSADIITFVMNDMASVS